MARFKQIVAEYLAIYFHEKLQKLFNQVGLNWALFRAGQKGKSFEYRVASKNLGSEMTNNFSKWGGKHFLKGGVAKFRGG